MLSCLSRVRLCDPRDCSLPGSCLWDFLGKNTGVGCHFLLQGGGLPGSYVSCIAGELFTGCALGKLGVNSLLSVGRGG